MSAWTKAIRLAGIKNEPDFSSIKCLIDGENIAAPHFYLNYTEKSAEKGKGPQVFADLISFIYFGGVRMNEIKKWEYCSKFLPSCYGLYNTG
ncbi:hypothetical protein HMPREF3209_00744 [Lactobacillus crispatus]|nr:hypothetical protein HMPREF3209_00744 [Lactobacillus crispatus]